MFRNLFKKNTQKIDNDNPQEKFTEVLDNEDHLNHMPKRDAANEVRDMEYERNNPELLGDSDPMIRFEKLIKNTSVDVLRKIFESVDNSDIAVASYYLGDEDKKIIFDIVGEKETQTIKEDQYFMGNPARCDVREACKTILSIADK